MQLRAIQVLKLLAKLLFELLGKGFILVVWFFRSRRLCFRRRSRFLLGGLSRLGRGGRFLVFRRNRQVRQQSERGHGKEHPSACVIHAGSLAGLVRLFQPIEVRIETLAKFLGQGRAGRASCLTGSGRLPYFLFVDACANQAQGGIVGRAAAATARVSPT